jgi:hypothetical protein
MAYEVTAFEHFDEYRKSPAFSAFHELSVRAYAAFHEHVVDAEPKPETDLIRRMMYVAEATSAALRLTASWAFTHPAFSLCRDRYEQCVRFSWLARQTDDREWHRYIADMYLRRNRLKKAFANRGIEVPELDDGFEELPDEKKKSFRHWENLSLDQLADRRDKLPGITGTRVDGETLRTLYDSIYRQGSSVSHYDLYSIQMLGLHDGPEGLVLAPDPAMPIVTVLHCALFDLIQCAEALARVERPASEELWNGAVDDWWTLVKRSGIMEVGLEPLARPDH